MSSVEKEHQEQQEDHRWEELRCWLRSQGATEEQLALDPCGGDEFHHIASDLVTTRGAHLSARELAARRGVEPEHIVDVFRSYGVAVPDLDEAQFSEGDAQLVAVTDEACILDDADGQGLARVVATGLDRIAEAAVAFYVQGAEKELLLEGASPLAWAQKTVHVTELAGRLGVGMGVLFRHHLRQAIGRQRVSQVHVTSRDVARMAVGFVDLVGSTALGETLDVADFRKMVSEFEAQAFEVAAHYGGRVVKFIGDEIMVAALDPATGCRLMLELVDACSTGGMQPRGGMSWGEVLFRGGDYFGREVNLASRLVDAAIPGEVLVDATVVTALEGTSDRADLVGTSDCGTVEAAVDPTLRFEPGGRRMLKGFGDPVVVWSVCGRQRDGDRAG